jgi:hypothetical protein
MHGEVDEPEGEVEPGVALKVVSQGLDTLSNPIAHDQEQHPTKPQVAGHGIHERSLVDHLIAADDLVERS